MAARLLERVFRLGLWLYPPAFRARFGAEMAAVFGEQLSTAAARGRLAVLRLAAREAAALAGQGLRERLYALQSRPALAAQTNAGGTVSTHRGPARRLVYVTLIAALLGLAAWLVWAFLMAAWQADETTPKVNQAALADLNGDGSLDAFLAIGHGNMPFPAYALYNDGTGRLDQGAQPIGNWPGYSVALGDVNGDGLPDALLDITAGGLVLYRNDGGAFRHDGGPAEPRPKGVMRLVPVIGDLNGDGRQDVFAAGCCGRPPGETPDKVGNAYQPPFSKVWLQTPEGRLSSGQLVGDAPSRAAALADLNGDGHLDVFLANGRPFDQDWEFGPAQPNTVWLNDGQGTFNDSGQALGQAESLAVALGDVDGDGDADAVVGNRGPDEVWLNDGQGRFADSDQRLDGGLTAAVFLADLDSDGDLDLFAAGEIQGRAWLNDGAGQFQRGGQALRYGRNEAVAVGDLDGDGDPDVLAVGAQSVRVWRNDSAGRFAAGPRHAFGGSP